MCFHRHTLPTALYCGLTKAIRQVQSTQGTSLNLLALVVKKAYIDGSHETITIENSYGQATTLRALHRQQTKTHHSLPVKSTHLLVLELQPQEQDSGLPHI